MNGTEWLLDTNAVITALHGDPSQLLPSGRYFVSVITELELLSYPSADSTRKCNRWVDSGE